MPTRLSCPPDVVLQERIEAAAVKAHQRVASYAEPTTTSAREEGAARATARSWSTGAARTSSAAEQHNGASGAKLGGAHHWLTTLLLDFGPLGYGASLAADPSAATAGGGRGGPGRATAAQGPSSVSAMAIEAENMRVRDAVRQAEQKSSSPGLHSRRKGANGEALPVSLRDVDAAFAPGLSLAATSRRSVRHLPPGPAGVAAMEQERANYGHSTLGAAIADRKFWRYTDYLTGRDSRGGAS
jgi:hypothetical protein